MRARLTARFIAQYGLRHLAVAAHFFPTLPHARAPAGGENRAGRRAHPARHRRHAAGAVDPETRDRRRAAGEGSAASGHTAGGVHRALHRARPAHALAQPRAAIRRHARDLRPAHHALPPPAIAVAALLRRQPDRQGHQPHHAGHRRTLQPDQQFPHQPHRRFGDGDRRARPALLRGVAPGAGGHARAAVFHHQLPLQPAQNEVGGARAPRQLGQRGGLSPGAGGGRAGGEVLRPRVGGRRLVRDRHQRRLLQILEDRDAKHPPRRDRGRARIARRPDRAGLRRLAGHSGRHAGGHAGGLQRLHSLYLPAHRALRGPGGDFPAGEHRAGKHLRGLRHP